MSIYASSSKFRSKLEHSSGQQNRHGREAAELLKAIEDTLSHEDFSYQEIFDEGITGGDEQYVTRCLNLLLKQGYVEVIDEDDRRYRLVGEKLSPPRFIESPF